jgi:glycosyltransferase involved in cell wall biosynthesis
MADGKHDIDAGAARSGARPAVSIVIPTFRRQQRLPLCLEWIARCRGAECAEIILIDQTPVCEWLPIDDRITNRFFSFERLHGSVPNIAAARNRGGMIASSELLLFLDDDVELEPEFLTGLLALFERDAVDVVGGVLVDSFAAAGIAGCGIERATWLPGPNTALRRKHFLAVGGYDENLFRYNEDAELCHRLRLSGLRIGRAAGLRAIHHHEPSGGTWHCVSLFDMARSVMLCDLYFARAVGGGFPAVVWRALRTIRHEWKGFGRINAGTILGRVFSCIVMAPVGCVAAYHRKPQTLPKA